MNWAKDNPFLAGFIVVSVLVVGGLGYFVYSNYTAYAELQGVYQAEVQKLHELQNRSPYPSTENLQKIKDSAAAYQQTLAELNALLDKYQLPLNPEVSPQQFQDELRKAVSQTQARASEAGVQLPADFYLGFDMYRAGLPSQEATPQLARQLKAIEGIINALIDTKVTSISQITRAALPIEGGAAAPVAKPAAPGAPAAPAAAKVEKNLLDLTFSGDQARVRLAINSLLASPQFLIVRALKIQNSAMAGPNKSGGAGAAGGAPEFNSQNPQAPQGEAKSALNMLFGRETISAQVRIELLQFQKTESAPAEKSK